MNYDNLGEAAVHKRSMVADPLVALATATEADCLVWPYYGGYHSLLCKRASDISLYRIRPSYYGDNLSTLFKEDCALIDGDYVIDGQYVPEISTFYASDLLMHKEDDLTGEPLETRQEKLSALLAPLKQQHLVVPPRWTTPEQKKELVWSRPEGEQPRHLGYQLRSSKATYEDAVKTWYVYLYTHQAYAMAADANAWDKDSLTCTDTHRSAYNVGTSPDVKGIKEPTVVLVSYTHAVSHKLRHIQVLKKSVKGKTEEACLIAQFKPSPFPSAHHDTELEITL